MDYSICLTVHNKGYLLERVLDGIYNNTVGNYELLVCLDGCSDNSEEVLLNTMRKHSALRIKTSVIYADNVFETRANNKCLKKSSGKYVVIIQDDQIITEASYNLRMAEPFKKFDDVFAVSARMAHNWKFNQNSLDISSARPNIITWSDVLTHCDHADQYTVPRNVFAVRDSVNRGPLMINREDLVKLNYLDEIYAPQEYDEHCLMVRARKELKKVCGFYHIGWESRPEYGGTRDESGNTKQWLFEANHKNTKIFYARHGNDFEMKIENRVIK